MSATVRSPLRTWIRSYYHPTLSPVQPLISVKLLFIYTGDYGERQVCQVQQITQTRSFSSREATVLVTPAGALTCQSVHGTIRLPSEQEDVCVGFLVTCKALCLFFIRIVKIDDCFKNESIQSNKPHWKLEVRAAVRKTDKEIHTSQEQPTAVYRTSLLGLEGWK